MTGQLIATVVAAASAYTKLHSRAMVAGVAAVWWHTSSLLYLINMQNGIKCADWKNLENLGI